MPRLPLANQIKHGFALVRWREDSRCQLVAPCRSRYRGLIRRDVVIEALESRRPAGAAPGGRSTLLVDPSIQRGRPNDRDACRPARCLLDAGSRLDLDGFRLGAARAPGDRPGRRGASQPGGEGRDRGVAHPAGHLARCRRLGRQGGARRRARERPMALHQRADRRCQIRSPPDPRRQQRGRQDQAIPKNPV